MRQPFATNHDLAHLRALAAEGKLQSEAAREMGWTPTRVRKWAIAEHIPFRTIGYVQKMLKDLPPNRFFSKEFGRG